MTEFANAPVHVCTRCGCLCDDIRISESDRHIRAAARACPAGEEWLTGLGPPVGSARASDGTRLPLQEAIRATADLLGAAKAPAIVGLAELTVECQRTVISLGEQLRCPLVPLPLTPAGLRRSGLMAPGLVASLEEVRSSADLVIFWRADPAVSHPRHLERHSGGPLPATSGPRRERTLLFVGGPSERSLQAVRASGGAAKALYYKLPLTGALATDRALVTALRWLLEREHEAAARSALAPHGIPLAVALDIAGRIRNSSRFQVFLGEEAAAIAPLWDQFQLLADQVAETHRAGIAALPPPGNARGMEEVAGWQTGLDLPADLAGSDMPRHRPPILDPQRAFAPGAVDIHLVAGLDPERLPGDLVVPYAGTRRIFLGPGPDPGAEISFRVPGLDPRLRGRVVRSDGAVLWLSGSPSSGVDDPALAILGGLLEELRSRARSATGRTRTPS